ncbi:MAG: maleylacetoacetate isomerase [Xanthomonadales bacterium]|nr:maleylacetoacetate isomerase [Xanthomonadales bacterium]
MAGSLKLYSYWRSSAAYRVRIALNLKQLPHEIIPIHLLRDGGEQHKPEFHQINPQDRIPVLVHGQRIITQSISIMEYLEEYFPENPIMPSTARERARVRSLAQIVACDIHPLNNLRVLQHLEKECAMPQPERDAWVRKWIEEGFDSLEALLADNPSTGDFCEGDNASIADCCLIPQVYNARRFGVDMAAYPTIMRIHDFCMETEEFDHARPEKQPDCPDAA